VLSIPRDLGVEIPGVGFSKINAAFADGGANGSGLLIQTLQQDVIPDLLVNHVFVVDFQSFADLITSLGCVYSDVDHRYYNYNNGSLANDYSGIDIQPGYQKLCGGPHDDGGPTSALAFVRFRHNDSDLVREARQQDFLRWAKEQFTATELLEKKNQLLTDFGEDVQTDRGLHSTDEVDELFGLAFNADGGSIKSIPFPTLGSVDDSAVGDYLTFSEAQAEQAYTQFTTPSPPPITQTTTTSTPSTTKKHKPKPYVPPATMQLDPTDGSSQAAELGAGAGLPVYYPKYIPDDYAYCFATTANCDEDTNPTSVYANSYPRRYSIPYDGTSYPSYVMTLVMGSPDYTDLGTGEYFTVQGTTWQDPPILRDPTDVKLVNGKLLDEYYQGGALTLVAWHTPTAVYWISNTIENNIPRAEMVAMAATLARGA